MPLIVKLKKLHQPKNKHLKFRLRKGQKGKIVNSPITDLASWLEAGKKPQKEPNWCLHFTLYTTIGWEVVHLNKQE